MHIGLTQPLLFDAKNNTPCTDPAERVHLECLSGVHYNPLTENKLFVPKQMANDLVANEDHLLWDEEADDLYCNLEPEITYLQPAPQCGHGPNGVTATVEIGGVICCAMLDTGAQVCLLSEEVWQQMTPDRRADCALEEDCTKLRNLGPSSSRTSGSIRGPWSLGGVPVECGSPFGRVKAGVISSCILIGANVSRELKLKVDYGDRSFSFVAGGTTHLRKWNAPEVSIAVLEDICYQSVLSTEDCFLSYIQMGYDHLADAQQSDRNIKKVVAHIRHNVPTSQWSGPLTAMKRHRSSLVVDGGRLWYTFGTRRLLVVPYNLMVEVAVRAHVKLIHLGRGKLTELLRTLIWHPEMNSVVGDICRTCLQCQQFKTHAQLLAPPVLKMAMTRPFELMSLDLLMLPTTPHGNKYCLVCVDHFSKWAALTPLKNKKGSTVADAFGGKILPFLPRVPERVLTDNGAEFTSELMKRVLEARGIGLSHSTPFKPSCNGGVERLNRTMVEALRCARDSRPWDERIGDVVISYNNSFHSSIRMSPTECLLTQEHAIKGDGLRPVVEQENWRDGHPKFAAFRVGDKVLRKTVLQGNLLSNKFSDRYQGPYRITKVRSSGLSYLLYNEDTGRESPAHHTQLTRFHTIPQYLM